MEVLIAILTTIPLSYVIDQLSFNELVKKAADLGYLPNLDAFKKGKEGDSKFDKYKRYIPFICLVDSIYRAIDQKINEQEHFEEMRIHGYFVPMTKDEEDYYNEKRTALRIYNLSGIRNEINKIVEKECIESNIKYLDKTLDEHEIVIQDSESEEKVNLDSYLKKLSKEELEELKNDIKIISEWNKSFDEPTEGDYTLNEKKGKKLIYRFNCKDSDNNKK